MTIQKKRYPQYFPHQSLLFDLKNIEMLSNFSANFVFDISKRMPAHFEMEMQIFQLE